MACNVAILQGAVHMSIQSFPTERTDARASFFSEQEAFWQIPLHEISAIVDVAVTKGKLQRQLYSLCRVPLPLHGLLT